MIGHKSHRISLFLEPPELGKTILVSQLGMVQNWVHGNYPYHWKAQD